jgi:hypothetical protein
MSGISANEDEDKDGRDWIPLTCRAGGDDAFRLANDMKQVALLAVGCQFSWQALASNKTSQVINCDLFWLHFASFIFKCKPEVPAVKPCSFSARIRKTVWPGSY